MIMNFVFFLVLGAVFTGYDSKPIRSKAVSLSTLALSSKSVTAFQNCFSNPEFVDNCFSSAKREKHVAEGVVKIPNEKQENFVESYSPGSMSLKSKRRLRRENRRIQRLIDLENGSFRFDNFTKIYPEPDVPVLFDKGPPQSNDLVFFANSDSLVVHDPQLGPNKNYTPGVLTTRLDPDFQAVYSGILRSKRLVGKNTKHVVAKLYGVPRSLFPLYEFDHLIPLGLGGSNHPSNIWPQLRDNVHKEKADLARELHDELVNGRIEQPEAIQRIFDHINQGYGLQGEGMYP